MKFLSKYGLSIKSTLIYLCLLIVGIPTATADTTSTKQINIAVDALRASSKGNIFISRTSKSPYISFLRVSPGSSMRGMSISRKPEDRARNFLQKQKSAFVAPATVLELVTSNVVNKSGIDSVRMQQLLNGVFVRGGEVVVQMDKDGITVVNSRLTPDFTGIDLVPSINPQAALTKVGAILLDRYGVQDITLSKPRLEIFNAGIFTGGVDNSKLTWFVQATATGVNEFVWIDAHSGLLVESLNQVARAHRNRNTADAALDPCVVLNAVILRTELSPPSGNNEVDAAHDLAGITYDYYLNTLGRHGINDVITSDATIFSVVNVCSTLSPAFDQPPGLTLEIAGLDATQMLYATGYAVDDIVGHEYTHRIINAPTSPQFLLSGESGALAESFADIFGEVIDRVNTGNDAGDIAWDVGEDTPTGPFRNMMRPGDYNFPDKVTSVNYYCGTDNDVYIHQNSAVLSHAFALAVDGGTFNNVQVAPVGQDKVARVYYNAMMMLTSTSLFIDAYNAIISATDVAVTGADITAADKTEIIDALNAVEMNIAPCVNAQIPYCPTGQSPQFVFKDGFENINSGRWTTTTVTGVNHWDMGDGGSPGDVYHSGNDVNSVAPIPRQGTYALFADTTRDNGFPSNRMGESNVAMTNSILIGQSYRMQFEHNFSFEIGPADGGLIEFSIDGGNVWSDAGSLITSGVAYNGAISGAQNNPLGNRLGFVDNMLEDMAMNPLYDYSSTQLSLASLQDSSVKFRFVTGTDGFGEARGWTVDDFSIYSCSITIFNISPTTGLTTNEGGKTADFQISLGAEPTGIVTLGLTSSNPSEGTVLVTGTTSASITFTAANWNLPVAVQVTGQDDTAADGNINYLIDIIASAPNDSIYDGVKVSLSITNDDNDVLTATPPGSSGGGGCSLSTRAQFDPVLPLLLLFSIVYLFTRKRMGVSVYRSPV